MAASWRSERGKIRRAIVVGGGVAGMSAALRLVESGVPVLLVSRTEERRAPSVSRQDGITACEAEAAAQEHLAQTLAAGSYLAHQPPIAELVRTAPRIVGELCAAGVPFERRADGRLRGRAGEGAREAHTYCAGTLTGQHVVRVLAEQVLRRAGLELCDARGVVAPGERWVERLVGWDLVDLVQDDRGAVIGVVAQELATGKVKAFAGDAVCLATGGAGKLFGAQAGLGSTVAGAAVALRVGAVFANADLLRVEPIALVGGELPRPIGAVARAAGARLWVPKKPRDRRAPHDIPEPEREYLFEEAAFDLGILAPGPALAKRLVALAREQRLPTSGDARAAERGVAYLELTHLEARDFEHHLSGLSDLCRTFARTDPQKGVVPVFPALTGLCGGLWVDYEAGGDGRLVADSPRSHATSVPGLYAAGDVEYQYHGAAPLAGNVLTACHVAGTLAARGMTAYRETLTRSALDLPQSLFERAEKRAGDRCDATLAEARGHTGSESTVFALQSELAALMNGAGGLEGESATFGEVRERLTSLDTELGSVRVADASARFNQSAMALREMADLLLLARFVVESSARRPPSAPASTSTDEPRVLMARRSEDGQARFVDEFSYECAGRSVTVTSRVDQQSTPSDPRRAWLWTIAASSG